MSAEAGSLKSTLAARVTVPEKVLFRDLGTEAVILELDSGRYYGLDEVGFRMWTLLEQHDGSVARAYSTLLEEYDVAEQDLERDLLAFVDLLAARKLLNLHDE